MAASPNIAEHIRQLLVMREHYLAMGSARSLQHPLDTEPLRYAAILASIDQLIADLQRL